MSAALDGDLPEGIDAGNRRWKPLYPLIFEAYQPIAVFIGNKVWGVGVPPPREGAIPPPLLYLVPCHN